MDIPEKDQRGICGVLAICLRAATLAGLELGNSRQDQVPSMRPIAWKEFVAFTGSIRGIWGVRVAYFLFLQLSLIHI